MGLHACRNDQQGEKESGQRNDTFVTVAIKELLQSRYVVQAFLNMTADKQLFKQCDKNNQPYDAKRLSKQARELAEKAVAKVMNKVAATP